MKFAFLHPDGKFSGNLFFCSDCSHKIFSPSGKCSEHSFWFGERLRKPFVFKTQTYFHLIYLFFDIL